MRRALELLRTARFAAPDACASALSAVLARHGVDFSGGRVRAGFARGHLLEILMFLPGGKGNEAEQQAGEDLVRRLLGEELYERWIGNVSVTASVRRGPLSVINSAAPDHTALPLSSLLETVQAAIRGLCAGLSEPVPSQGAADWFAFELQPEMCADYLAQDDLLFCSTRQPESKKCFLRGEPFFSERFGGTGTLFTYLKYESVASSPSARVHERSLFEGALGQALSEDRGAIIGLGLGVRYSYIDLWLRDPDCVHARLFPALRAAGIAPRAWLLFCDSELDQEYRPVYAGSPAPRLPSRR